MSTNDRINLRLFAKDSSYNLIRQIWTAGIGIANSVLLARGLGVDGRGIYAVAILLPLMLANFFNGGISSATVYVIGRNERELASVVRGNIALALWLGLLGVVVGLVIVRYEREALLPGPPSELLYGSLLLVPVMLYQGYLLSIFQGLEDFKNFNLLKLLPQTLNFLLILLFVWGGSLGVWGALLALTISSYIVAAILTIAISRLCPQEKLFRFWLDPVYTAQIMSFGLRSHLSNVLAFLNYRADILLLNFFTGSYFVGLYALAVTIAEKLWLLSTSVSTTLFPKIASLKDDFVQQDSITPVVARHILWLSVAMAIAAYIVAPWGVETVYGHGFVDAADALRILLPGIVMGSLSNVMAQDIAGRGRPELNSLLAFGSLIVNVIANLLLIPLFGFRGAALATTISYSMLTLARLFLYCRITDVTWTELLFLTKQDVSRLQKIMRTAFMHNA